MSETRAGHGPTRIVDAEDPADATSLRAVLASIGETLYDWDIGSDRIVWGASAARVLRVDGVDALATGRSFAHLLVPDAGTSRYDTVSRSRERDTGFGVRFQTVYALRTESGEVLWVEDTGRWFAGLDGRPGRVHGVVRVIQAPLAADGHVRSPHSDPLTGALTRSQLGDLLTDEIGRARRENRPLAMALVAIEGLADVNRTFGFDTADHLIAAAARRLRAVMRRGDALARYSGNKFAVILMGCVEEQLPVACARFCDAIRAAPLECPSGAVPAAVRIGALQLPKHAHTASQAMQNAEDALSSARQSGRPFVVYSPDRRGPERREETRRHSDDIIAALNERRVLIVHQAVVAARGRQVAFCEALVRLRERDGSVTPAGHFVPMAESLGLVPLLDARVLELATAELAADPALSLSLNVSPATMRDPEWLDALAGQLSAAPDAAGRLIVELTETCAVDDIDGARDAIAAIRELGARVAIDDFGAGHTSFRNLRSLGVDMVKIDGAFVQNLSRSSDDRFFVRTLIDLAQHVGLTTVAEWVRDEETARQLEDWGVDYLQGELFGDAVRPGPATRARAGLG